MSGFFGMVLIIFITFGISFILINIRHIIRGQEFRGTCASASPAVTKQIGACTMCGAKPGEACGNPDLEK